MLRAHESVPVDYGGPVDRPFEPFPCSTLAGSITDRFSQTVRRFPERVAVSDLTRSLSYAELAGLVDRIAVSVDTAAAEQPGPAPDGAGVEGRGGDVDGREDVQDVLAVPGPDDRAVARVGIHWATEQCRDLLDNNVRGIHFYTLNRSDATRQIYENLGVTDSAALRV